MKGSTAQVDLTNCDRELIHLPGRIQSHGFLIVLDNSFFIRSCSDNVSNFLKGSNAGIIGEKISYIESFLGNNYVNGTIVKTLEAGRLNHNFGHTNPLVLTIQKKTYYLVITDAGDKFLLEFEPAILNSPDDIQRIMDRSITLMLANRTLQELLDNAAAEVKAIIGYDRVMIYKFASDGHGKVVAEAANPNLEPFLGLHYPASDIPQQARALYKLNHTRLIASVDDTTAAILTTGDNTAPLDLTYSQLRAVSPIHIQYLRNMGVASSYSISLLYSGDLWGLIACHNYTPKFIDFKLRESSRLIGQLLSSALSFRQEEENKMLQQVLSKNLELMTKQLQQNDRVADALTTGEVTIFNLLQADGVALFYENQLFTFGQTPDEIQLKALTAWLKESVDGMVYSSHFLSGDFPAAQEYKSIASGILYLSLSKEFDENIIWFRKEQLQVVKWAGDPNKLVEIKEGLAHISPRHSFQEWKQEVSGKSIAWPAEEIKLALRLRDEILYAVNLKARALRLLNDKLQFAYEELDTFSYTISHDLKNPLTIIKSYSQLLRMDNTLSQDAGAIVARIEDRADKMNFMINAILGYSRIGRNAIVPEVIDMGVLISEIVQDYSLKQGDDHLAVIIGDTPAISGDAVMIGQVFNNLIGNAVKYSTHGQKGSVHIEGKKEERGVCYSISDNGIGIKEAFIAAVFDLFRRMDNVKDIEGTGVGLAIVKRIVDKHQGSISVRSTLGKGSVFTVCFPTVTQQPQ